MSEKELLQKLSEVLFWDVNRETFDTERHSGQLIQKVLEHGTLDDWRTVRDYYGMERIVNDCKQLRTLPVKALYFVCAMSDTKPEEYRCYHFAQSNPTLWNS